MAETSGQADPDRNASDIASTVQAASSPSQAVADAQPPLGIIHLLGWTACCAVALGYSRRWLVAEWAAEVPVGVVTAIVGALSLSTGAELGGVVLWIARRWRKLPFPRQPGEWLLLIGGVSTLCSVVPTLLHDTIFAESRPPFAAAVGPFATAVLTIVALARRSSRETGFGPWKGLFLAQGFFGGLGTVIGVMVDTDMGAQLFLGFRWLLLGSYAQFPILLLMVVISIIVDLASRKRRGWLHWVGALALLWSELVTMTWTVYFMWDRFAWLIGG